MISGTGFQRDYARRSGRHLTGAEIVTAADAGDRHADDALEAYAQRLGRALARLRGTAPTVPDDAVRVKPP